MLRKTSDIVANPKIHSIADSGPLVTTEVPTAHLEESKSWYSVKLPFGELHSAKLNQPYIFIKPYIFIFNLLL